MSTEVIQNWASKAKIPDGAIPMDGEMKVLRRVGTQSRGNAIMEIAERLRPWFLKMFEGVRDENGMVMQPARIRAMTLNIAQCILQEDEQDTANA